MKLRFFLLCFLPLLAVLSGCSQAQQAPTSTVASRANTRVLLITGDWKSQAWYQQVWNNNKKPMRGRFIAAQVEKASPGKFTFTHLDSYEGLQYVDANFLTQFDVLLIGDTTGFSMSPTFLNGVQQFVQKGGGLGYLASWKWHTTLLDSTPFEQVLPARFGIEALKTDWNNFNSRAQTSAFKPEVAAANHPIVRGLNWGAAPNLSAAFKIIPKESAQVLLKTPSGAPILVAGEVGSGRSVLSASIFSNDELSGDFAEKWPDLGRYYAQLLSWLGEKSKTSATPLKMQTGMVDVQIDATKTLNTVSAKAFSIHASHDDPNIAPLQGKALESFQALNLNGGFTRLLERDVEPQNDNDDPNSFNRASFKFGDIDKQMAETKRLNLEPILLVTSFRYGSPKWLASDGSSITKPSDRYAAEVAEQCAAIVEHLNGGKGNSPNYKLNLKYLEVGNEPEINNQTVDAFVKIFKAVAVRIHRDYPGVKVGAFGGYELPYLYGFMEKAGNDIDWISRHPYGWTGEMIFEKQDEYAAWRKTRGLKPVEFIITEWDFWIQGKSKFDYMIRRNFEAVKRADLAGTLHYRLGQYDEGGYLFGVLWAGWGQQKGAGEKGAPMHDAYDAFWAFRNFRGARAPVTVATPSAPGLEKQIQIDSVRDGDKLNTVLYYARGGEGTGWKDFANGTHYNKVRVSLKLTLPPSKAARTLTLSKANGEGFEVLPQKVAVPANATMFSHIMELEPGVAWSLMIQ